MGATDGGEERMTPKSHTLTAVLSPDGSHSDGGSLHFLVLLLLQLLLSHSDDDNRPPKQEAKRQKCL